MTMQRQLSHYGRHLSRSISELEIPEPAVGTIRLASAQSRGGPRRWVIALAGAAIVAAAVAAALAVMLGGGSTVSEFVSGDGSTVATTKEDSGPAVAMSDGGLVRLEPVTLPVDLPWDLRLSSSGDTIWAWVFDELSTGEDVEIVAFRDRASVDAGWVAVTAPGRPVLDVTGAPEGTVWALLGVEEPFTIAYLQGGEWVPLEGAQLPAALVGEASDIEIDPGADVIWVAARDELLRWDGSDWEVIAGPVTGLPVDSIAVSGDGTVWASHWDPFIPGVSGIARYDPDTGAWEPIRPLGGDQDVPAILVIGPDDVPWALLYPEGLDGASVLARYDSEAGVWATFDIPGSPSTRLVAGVGTVWLIGSPYRAEGVSSTPSLRQFDGTTWTAYWDLSAPDELDSAAIGPDGSLWVSVENGRGLHVVVPEGDSSG